MVEFLQNFFVETPFIPHGHCYLWKPSLVWLHVVSDCLIALAYYSIPFTLVYFVRKRKDLPFDWIFLLFGAFIISCGSTHIMEIWTLWHSSYWLAGFLKALTAVVSLYTAMALVPLVPRALTLPSPTQLETANRQLEVEIVERRRIEEKLRSSQEMLQLVMDNIPQFIFWKDRNSVYLGCNRSFAQLTGLNHPEEVIGKTDYDLPWRAQQTAYVRECDARVIETDSPEEYLMETQRQVDGQQIWMNTKKIPLHDLSGKVIGILASAEDITEQKRAEEALRESEERWHLVLKGNNDGIWDWNLKTNQAFRSPRFMEILGYEDGELGTSHHEWQVRIHPDDVERVITASQAYLERKIPHYAVEYRMQCKNGTYKWVLSRGQAQWDEQGNPVRMVGSTSDITQRKQAELALYQLNAELEERVQQRTAELEAANQLLLGQTHVLEMLARGASLAKVLDVLIRTIEAQSSEMVCSILVLSKPVRINAEHVALPDKLQSYFSEAIVSSTGEVLGMVTLSYGKERQLSVQDLQLRQTAAYIAGIAIENQQMEQERSRLVAILQASSDYIGMADPEGNSLWYNNQLKQALGLRSQAEITKRPVSDNHPQWAVEVIETQGIPTAIRDGIWVGETAVCGKDGVEIPVSHMLIAHKSPNGQVEYFSTIMRDLSDVYDELHLRKRAEAALQESYNLLETVINSTPDSIFVKDRQGRYQLMNAPGARMFNKSVEEIIGQDDTALFVPEIAAQFRQSDDRIITSGQTETYEETVFVQGEWRTYITSKTLYHDAQGNIMGLVGTAKDITERKHTETALIESYNLLQSIINATPDAIFVKNLQHRYLVSNSVRASLFHKTVEEIFGKDDGFLFSPELCAKIQADDTRIMTSGNTETIEEEFIVENEPRTYLTTKSVYRDAQGTIQGMVGFAKDITPLKAANTELARSNQELEQFAYVASHDLQEPLRKIKSYTDLLAKRYQGQLDEKADKYIAYIADGAVRMQALITDLLTYSRVGKGELIKEPTDLNAVLNLTLRDLSRAIRESKAIITADPLPTVNANPRQIGQLLQNLIANAIKFHGEQPPQIQIKALRCNQFWTISVQDNGIGIHPQYAERIFVIFQRLHTKDEYEGTGIGLALCKKIVERHGGRIWVESELKRKTTFFVTLPTV